MGARRYGSFCNDDSTHFSVLGVSAHALDNCYLRIVDSFIFIHSRLAFLPSKGLLCLYDKRVIYGCL